MVRRNKNLLRQNGTIEKQRWTIRKLSIGVVSVFIGTTCFYLVDGGTRVNADSSGDALQQQVLIHDSASSSLAQSAVEQRADTPVADQESKTESSTNQQQDNHHVDTTNDNQTRLSESSEDNKIEQTARLDNHVDRDAGQVLNVAVNDNKAKAEMASTEPVAASGFTVTDPEYPSDMYRDPNPDHYSFLWVGQTGNGYQTVISTNRNGDGQIHVFELDQNNTVINSFDLDRNQNRTSQYTGATYYNDEYAGLIRSGSRRRWTLKYEVSGGKSDRPYDAISFIVPRLNTQTTSYHDENGNDITDKNGEKVASVVQQGLDGQKYTTTGTKIINGYYAEAPANAQGTMSPYGQIGSKYEKNWHNGYIAEFTQINSDGDMSVQMYYQDNWGRRNPVGSPILIKPGDIDVYSGVNNIYLRSIYVPQTTDIRYTYKVLGNTILVDENNDPFKGNTPTQYPNDPTDPTKAGKVVVPQYEGYTPTINGNPVDPNGFIPTDPGEDTTVVYVANPAKALVRFIDETENRTLTELESNGKTAETIDFSKADDQLKYYLDRGYKVVANGIPTTETKFDTIDDSNEPSQVFIIRLEHDTVTVTPNQPVTPGDKINPNDPASPTYTQDQAKVNEDHYLTIHYVGAPNNPADNQQSSHWTRTVTVDKVTGKTLSSTDWSTNDSYVEVKTPEIAGYTPDKQSVTRPTTREDHEVTVTYTANPARALVRFIDGTENRTLTELEPNGRTAEVIDFSGANNRLQYYLDRGYKVATNGIPTAETKFDTTDDSNGPSQVFIVRLEHDTITVTPDQPVTPGDKINPNDPSSPTYTQDQAKVSEDHYLTIHYIGAPNNPADNQQRSHWTRTVTIDKVTGKTLSGTNWSTTDNYAEVKTPEIAGYTPDKQSVHEPTVREDREITVTYVKENQNVPDQPKDTTPPQNNEEQPKENEPNNITDKIENNDTVKPEQRSTTLVNQSVATNDKAKETKTLPQTGTNKNTDEALLGSLLLGLAIFFGLPHKRKREIG